jgi:hypothetical protein
MERATHIRVTAVTYTLRMSKGGRDLAFANRNSIGCAVPAPLSISLPFATYGVGPLGLAREKSDHPPPPARSGRMVGGLGA